MIYNTYRDFSLFNQLHFECFCSFQQNKIVIIYIFWKQNVQHKFIISGLLLVHMCLYRMAYHPIHEPLSIMSLDSILDQSMDSFVPWNSTANWNIARILSIKTTLKAISLVSIVMRWNITYNSQQVAAVNINTHCTILKNKKNKQTSKWISIEYFLDCVYILFEFTLDLGLLVLELEVQCQ